MSEYRKRCYIEENEKSIEYNDPNTNQEFWIAENIPPLMYHHLVKGTDTKENKCKRIEGKEVIIQFFEPMHKKGADDPDNKEYDQD
ncbi:hypothetical protein [Paraflavitalea soli]|uniref:hypothetical protein n=1 Tax=Paraflavitalea soli TaxID=2315862 RepID=UPI0013C3EA35|nr:hypothetical protein [Paraflavitalea soli]